jgi:hypothetical protein
VRALFAFLGILAVPAAAVVAASYLWLNYDRVTQAIFSAAQPLPSQPEVTLKDYEAFQQETAASLRSATENIAAQKADLERLSGQVSALAASINALQKNAAAGVTPNQPAPTRPSVVTAQTKPPTPKTTGGPISVGGAPLPSTPTDSH